MKLPDESIGISDTLAHRECPRRMSYGMRRHTGLGTQSDYLTPEAPTYYGTPLHDCIHAVEEGSSDDDAIQTAVARYGQALEPGDLELLGDDLALYRARDFPNTRTVAAEDEFRVPLFTYAGRRVFFRFKLDRLYERLDAPGTYIHVDYKSSKHAKSEKEVHEDLQMWSYNFGIHEFFPEVDTLLQVYDQLRYGQIPTRKSEVQRRQIREWLVKQITAVIEDEDWQDDGLLAPRFNRWCKWCPIMESCPVIDELSEFSLVEIAAAAPTEKIGRKKVVQVAEQRLPEYAAQLEKVRQARGVLEGFEDAVKRLIREMPAERRAELGYELRTRRATVFDPRAAEALHERLGPRFFEAVKITKTGLEAALVEDPALLEWALTLGDEVDGAALVLPVKAQ